LIKALFAEFLEWCRTELALFVGNTGKALWWCLLGKTWTFPCAWILHHDSAIPHDMLADWEFFVFKN
jgi:hypothetical protein